MKEMNYAGKTYNHVGDFGHLRVLADIEQPLTPLSGIVVDRTTDTVVCPFGEKTWQEVCREELVPLFRLACNGASAWASDVHEAVNRGLWLSLSERGASVIVNHDGTVVATVTPSMGGAIVVHADTGAMVRWRNLTWVNNPAGEPVALVGTLNGRIVQV